MTNELKSSTKIWRSGLGALALLAAASFTPAVGQDDGSGVRVPSVGSSGAIMASRDLELYQCINHSGCVRERPTPVYDLASSATSADAGSQSQDQATAAFMKACRPARAQDREARAMQCLRKLGYFKAQDGCSRPAPSCGGGRPVCSEGQWHCVMATCNETVDTGMMCPSGSTKTCRDGRTTCTPVATPTRGIPCASAVLIACTGDTTETCQNGVIVCVPRKPTLIRKTLGGSAQENDGGPIGANGR
jgi:hypothetical protein